MSYPDNSTPSHRIASQVEGITQAREQHLLLMYLTTLGLHHLIATQAEWEKSILAAARSGVRRAGEGVVGGRGVGQQAKQV